MNLEQRVASLESLTAELAAQAGASRRSARRWRTAALASGLALVGGIGLAANSSRQIQDSITAESIEIVDGDENVVMELTSDSAGGLLRLKSTDGEVVGQFEVYEEGGYFSIRNPDEQELVVLHCDELGGVIGVLNTDGGLGGSMRVDNVGGILTVRSTDDEEVTAIMDILDDTGRVFVRNADGDSDEFMP